jgi:DNA polymerase III alpha subunit
MTDIDIDFANRDDILKIIKHIPALIHEKGVFKKHSTGVYCHSIPFNPITNTASIEYKSAEDRGYFKIDFLNVSVYQNIKNEDHINELLAIEPVWELLGEKDICDKLVHINGYHSLLAKLAPRSITELAMVLALIRPGKRHLVEQCQTMGFDSIKDEIWTKPSDGSYSFKHSHSVGYAHLIVMQLNLLCQQLSYEYS